MRELFENQLKTLNENLTTMGTMCIDCITFATQALLTSHVEIANKSIALEDEIDEKKREIENLCMKILLKQQPVAHDLKTISNALKMITDLERIGDQASDIAEIARHICISQSKHSMHIAQMSDAVINMVMDAIRSFVNQDKTLAVKVIKQDDIVDDLFSKIRKDLVDMMCRGIIQKEEYAQEAISTLMIAKYLERIGDHIVNVAECVED
ncbi:MAG: phosphate signaling complex protein PhoU [Treponema sp.]|nr:phosphate signaling complex protein PhoU [Treponema sp.]